MLYEVITGELAALAERPEDQPGLAPVEAAGIVEQGAEQPGPEDQADDAGQEETGYIVVGVAEAPRPDLALEQQVGA